MRISQNAFLLLHWQRNCVMGTLLLIFSCHLSHGASLESGSRKIISTTGSNPTWSPDSSKIAYGHDGPGGIVIVDVRTLEQRKFAEAGKDPAWSPDNLWIAFVSTPDGNICVQALAKNQSVLKIAQGFYPQWLSMTKELVYGDPKTQYLVAAKLSPDASGARLLQTRNLKKVSDPYTVLSPNGESYAFKADDGLRICSIRNAADSMIIFPTRGERGFLMDWSPDCNRLVVGGFMGSKLGLWIVDARSSEEPWKLVPEGVKPAWAPDGKRIAFDRSALKKDPGIEIIEVGIK